MVLLSLVEISVIKLQTLFTSLRSLHTTATKEVSGTPKPAESTLIFCAKLFSRQIARQLANILIMTVHCGFQISYKSCVFSSHPR